MPIHAFLARPFEHTHENEVFDLFLERLEAKWGQTDEEVIIIGNPLWNGCDPDCVVLRRNAITVVDFKNFGGMITIQENGPWRSVAGPVKGGSKANPLYQLRDNKYALKGWFERRFARSPQEFGHISGLVVFHQPVTIEGELPRNIQTWFKVTDLDRAADILGYFASNGINLSNDTLLAIPDQIGVGSYSPIWKRHNVERLQGPGALTTAPDRPEWTQGQLEAINELRSFLANPTKTAFRLLGMSSTGKSALLKTIGKLAQELARPVVWLAPNSRLAGLLTCETGHTFVGLYSHLFDASSEAVCAQITEQGNKKISVHPFRPCDDAEDCIYVIEEAQLIGNSYFEVESERFGSGKLWDDFLAFSKLGGGPRKVVLVGDPYQLHRGGKAEMPIHGDALAAKGHSIDAYELEQVIVEDCRKALTGNAKLLVQAMRWQRYNCLRLESDNTFQLVPRGDNLAFALDKFRKDDRRYQLICHTNQSVSHFNARLRAELFETNGLPLVSGDRVELYSPVKSEDPFEESMLFGTGRLASVTTSALHIEEKEQILKGRDKAITWRVASTSLLLDEDATRIPELTFLMDFLAAERPELDSDRVVALKVYYRESDYGSSALGKKTPARLRYAYATTCHHAQGTRKPSVIIDTNTGQGRCNEDYFRWLYTAITRAKQEVFLLNYTALTPLKDARWSDTGVRLVKDIKGGLTLKVDPTITPSDEDLARTQPEWSVEPTLAQFWFWLEAAKCLEHEHWIIAKVASHPYQEHYDLLGPNEERCTLALSYTKNNEVTGIRALRGTDTATPLALIGRRSAEIVLRDPRGQAPFDEIRTRLTSAGYMIEHVGESDYLLSLRLAKEGTEKAKLDIHFNGDGMVSTIRAVEVTSSELLGALRTRLCNEEGPHHE